MKYIIFQILIISFTNCSFSQKSDLIEKELLQIKEMSIPEIKNYIIHRVDSQLFWNIEQVDKEEVFDYITIDGQEIKLSTSDSNSIESFKNLISEIDIKQIWIQRSWDTTYNTDWKGFLYIETEHKSDKLYKLKPGGLGIYVPSFVNIDFEIRKVTGEFVKNEFEEVSSMCPFHNPIEIKPFDLDELKNDEMIITFMETMKSYKLGYWVK